MVEPERGPPVGEEKDDVDVDQRVGRRSLLVKCIECQQHDLGQNRVRRPRVEDQDVRRRGHGREVELGAKAEHGGTVAGGIRELFHPHPRAERACGLDRDHQLSRAVERATAPFRRKEERCCRPLGRPDVGGGCGKGLDLVHGGKGEKERGLGVGVRVELKERSREREHDSLLGAGVQDLDPLDAHVDLGLGRDSAQSTDKLGRRFLRGRQERGRCPCRDGRVVGLLGSFPSLDLAHQHPVVDLGHQSRDGRCDCAVGRGGRERKDKGGLGERCRGRVVKEGKHLKGGNPIRHLAPDDTAVGRERRVRGRRVHSHADGWRRRCHHVGKQRGLGGTVGREVRRHGRRGGPRGERDVVGKECPAEVGRQPWRGLRVGSNGLDDEAGCIRCLNVWVRLDPLGQRACRRGCQNRGVHAAWRKGRERDGFDAQQCREGEEVCSRKRCDLVHVVLKVCSSQ